MHKVPLTFKENIIKERHEVKKIGRQEKMLEEIENINEDF